MPFYALAGWADELEVEVSLNHQLLQVSLARADCSIDSLGQRSARHEEGMQGLSTCLDERDTEASLESQLVQVALKWHDESLGSLDEHGSTKDAGRWDPMYTRGGLSYSKTFEEQK